MGTGIHLQLRQLLDKLPDDTDPHRLATLLCPLLAQNADQQAIFYDTFGECYEIVFPTEKKQHLVKEEPINEWRKRLITASIIVGLLLLGYILYRAFFITHSPAYPAKTAIMTVNVLDSTTRCIILPEGKDFIDFSSLANGDLVGSDNLGAYRLDDETGCLTYYANEIIGTADTITVIALYDNIPDTTFFLVSVIQDTVIIDDTFIDHLKPKNHPVVSNLASLKPALPSAQAIFWANNKYWIAALWTLLLAGLAYLLARWLERKKELIAERETKDKPPYIWSIEIDNIDKIAYNEKFYLALNQLRQRTDAEQYELDIEQTIKATIENSGMVQFKYAQRTKPSEYLLLIDRHNSSNHRALLFDLFFQTFKENDVIVERFYFDGDIRVLYNEQHPTGLRLKDLQHRYTESRLILLGNGYQLLSPMSGKLAKWTAIFDSWKDKAILSPQPSSSWGRREVQLQSKFIFLPSTLEGLLQVVEQFEEDVENDLKDWTSLNDKAYEPITFKGDLIKTLHHYYEKDGDNTLVKWIAATAIYPTMHWDLTLFLGKELSTPNVPLLSIENIMQINRLPWFVEGKMPKQVRIELLEWFETTDPKTLLALRKNLHLLLQKQQVPTDSSAYDDHRMNMVLNELEFVKDPERRKALEQEFKELLDSGVEPDFTALKTLNRPRTPLDFVIPNNLKPLVYPEGKPFYGWKPKAWIYPVWLILAIIPWLIPKHNLQCAGEPVFIDDLELCLDEPRDYLIFWDNLAREYIMNGEIEQADSLVQNMRDVFRPQQEATVQKGPRIQATPANRLMVDSFLTNVAVSYYNKGVDFYNKKLDNGEPIQISPPTQQTQLPVLDQVKTPVSSDSACFYFEKAFAVDSLDGELVARLQECGIISTINDYLPSSISGEVVDGYTNEPVSGVSIILPKPLLSATTNARGEFTIDLIGNDRTVLDLTFEKENYTIITVPVDLTVGDRQAVFTLYPIGGQQTTTEQEEEPVIPINPTYVLTGNTLDAVGENVVGNVLIRTPYGMISSDSRGRYRLEFQAPEEQLPFTFDIGEVNHQFYTLQPNADKRVTFNGLSAAKDIYLIGKSTLTPQKTTIYGIVTDVMGNPVADASIQLIGTKDYDLKTDAKGTFSQQIEGVATDYTVKVEKLGYAYLEQKVTSNNLRLNLKNPATRF